MDRIRVWLKLGRRESHSTSWSLYGRRLIRVIVVVIFRRRKCSAVQWYKPHVNVASMPNCLPTTLPYVQQIDVVVERCRKYSRDTSIQWYQLVLSFNCCSHSQETISWLSLLDSSWTGRDLHWAMRAHRGCSPRLTIGIGLLFNAARIVAMRSCRAQKGEVGLSHPSSALQVGFRRISVLPFCPSARQDSAPARYWYPARDRMRPEFAVQNRSPCFRLLLYG